MRLRATRRQRRDLLFRSTPAAHLACSSPLVRGMISGLGFSAELTQADYSRL